MRPNTNTTDVQFQNLSLDKIVERLRLVAYADPETLAKFNDVVEQEATRLNADRTPSTDKSKEIAATCATTLKAGVTDAVALRMAGDARVIAGIPKDSLAILKVMHGDNPAKIAAAFLDTQRQVREGKIR